MNKLPTFDDKTEQLHEDCLQGKVLANLAKVDASDYASRSSDRSMLQKYLGDVKEYICSRRCLKARPDVLKQIVEDVEEQFFHWRKIGKGTPLGKLNKRLEYVFGYSRFRDKKGHLNDNWGGEVLMRRLLKDVRYCPYCNAETVYAIEMKPSGKGRAPLIKVAFDHFYPKGRYPFLSVSLYNLIPSCYRCNSQFKIAHYKELNDTLHPYTDSVDSVMRFIPGAISSSAWNGGDVKGGLDLLFIPKTSTLEEDKRRGENFAELFQIQRVYSQLYGNEALAMLQKCRIFDDEYIRQIEDWFAAAGLNNVDVKQLIFNVPFDRAEINKHRLSKMLNDMRDFWLG